MQESLGNSVRIHIYHPEHQLCVKNPIFSNYKATFSDSFSFFGSKMYLPSRWTYGSRSPRTDQVKTFKAALHKLYLVHSLMSRPRYSVVDFINHFTNWYFSNSTGIAQGSIIIFHLISLLQIPKNCPDLLLFIEKDFEIHQK